MKINCEIFNYYKIMKNIRITEAEFVKSIEYLQAQNDFDCNFETAMASAFKLIDTPIYDNGHLWSCIIEMLSKMTSDEDNIIYSWVYDTNFGTDNDSLITKGGESVTIKDAKQLYDYLKK